MEIFQTNVRHIVLRIKASEEKQKEFREKLANIYRTVQNHPIPNDSMRSDFTSFTKELLTHLKETDEQNKSLRATLREVLIKIREQKFVKTKKTAKILSVNEGGLSSENPFKIPYIQRSHQIERQINLISSVNGTNTQAQRVQIQNFGNLASTTTSTEQTKVFTSQRVSVNFENVLTMKFSKFADERTINRMKISPMDSGENSDVEISAFFCILQHFEIQERKKIKCKIKR